MAAWSWHRLMAECGGDEDAALLRLADQRGWGEATPPNPYPYADHPANPVIPADVNVRGPEMRPPWMMDPAQWVYFSPAVARDHRSRRRAR